MDKTAAIPLHALSGANRAKWLTLESWLLEAAPHRETAAREWSRHGVALLQAGLRWDAVRVPYAVLHPDFDRSTTPQELRGRLEVLQVFGAVFCDPYRPFAYFLVPPGTDEHWPSKMLALAGIECLGGTRPYVHHIGVPRLGLLAPPGLYWLVPPANAVHPHVNPEHLHDVLHACLAQRQATIPGTT